MDQLKKFVADGGMRSRKLWLSIGCIALLTAMVFAAARWSVVVGLYPEYVGGVLGVLSVFAGANVAGRWGVAKHLGQQLGDSDKPADSDQPEARP